MILMMTFYDYDDDYNDDDNGNSNDDDDDANDIGIARIKWFSSAPTHTVQRKLSTDYDQIYVN